MASAGTISVDAVLNSAQIVSELDKLTSRVDRLGKTFDDAGELIGRWGARLIEFAGAREALQVIEQTAEGLERLANAAQETNTSIEAMIELKVAAENLGIPLEGVSNMLFQLERRLGAGDKNTTRYLEALGLDINELKKLHGDELLKVVGEKIFELKNVSDQAAVSQAFFGRSIRETKPLLREYVTGNEEAIVAASTLGLELTKFDVTYAVQGKKGFDTLRVAGQSFAQQLTLAATPYLIEFNRRMLDVENPAGKARTALDNTAKVVYALSQFLMNGYYAIKMVIDGLVALGAQALSQVTFGKVSEIARDVARNAQEQAIEAKNSIKSIDQILADINSIMLQAQVKTEEAIAKAAAEHEKANKILTLGTLEKFNPADYIIRAVTDSGEKVTLVLKKWWTTWDTMNKQLSTHQATEEKKDLAASLKTWQDYYNTRQKMQERDADIQIMLEGEVARQREQLGEVLLSSTEGLLGALAAKHQAAAIALIVIEKARSIASIFMHFEEAKALAMAVLPPGVAEARWAQLTAMEAISIAAVAATGLVEISNTMSSGGGGGGGYAGASPANAAYQTNAGQKGSPFKPNVTEVYVKGVVTDRSGRILVDLISDQIKAGDVVLFDLNSRQARNLGLAPS